MTFELTLNNVLRVVQCTGIVIQLVILLDDDLNAPGFICLDTVKANFKIAICTRVYYCC